MSISLNPQLTLRQLLSLSLFSAGGLALEIMLTRLLSTLYYPPFIFAALALAVLGIGLGAALATWRDVLRQQQYIAVWMTITGALAVLLAPGVVWVATTNFVVLLVISLTLPYIFIGLAITAFFSAAPERSPLLYAFDLTGAGIGALLAIVVANGFGALDGLIVIAVLLLLAGVFYNPQGLTIGVFGTGMLVLLSQLSMNWLTVDMTALNSEKPIHEALQDEGHIIESHWDAFARTDLVQPPGNQPYRLYVDGAAASVVPPAENNAFLMSDIGLFAFVTAQPETVFTIGSGGGLDVWFGQRVGAQQITAVEANPQSILLAREYGEYNGDIYDQPNVRVLIDEGRSVLRREDRSYDLIYLAQVVTLTAERSGYALTENSVFTVQAFQDYWDHLTDEGYLALKLYDEPTLSRSLTIVVEMLKQQGLTDQQALHHMVVLLSPATSPPTPLMIVRKTPFEEAEAAAIGRAVQQIGFASLYLPGIQADPPLDTVESGVNTLQEVIDVSPLDLSAPTDDRPFFYQFERGIPGDLRQLLNILGVVLVVGFLILAGGNWRAKMPAFWGIVFYFSALGAGFMLVEITFIQYTRLFIGHPTPAVTSILATVLISGGLGSAWSQRFNLRHRLWLPLVVIAILIVIWVLLWRAVSTSLLELPTPARIAIAALTVAPVGFVMGIPFAAGLKASSRLNERYVPLAWSINGVMTVTGSVLGITVALLYGYTVVLIGGALIYAFGALAGLWLTRSRV